MVRHRNTPRGGRLYQGIENIGYSLRFVILLPYNQSGVFKVLYKRRPAPIVNNGEMDDKTEIDLDVELCALLPVLIAAYVWIDDEPQKSEYYKYLYSERAAEIERKGKDTSPVIIKSSNGW